MMRQPRAIEVMDVAFWGEKSGIGSIWHPVTNPMCTALKNGYKHFDAGYHEGIDEKSEEEKRLKAAAGK